LSGLAAGLLKQPKKGRRKMQAALSVDEDPKVLNKRIQSLENELDMTRDLVLLLRELPGNREALKKAADMGKKKKPRESLASGGNAAGGGTLPGLTAPYGKPAGGE
jgi:hypothetical protein